MNTSIITDTDVIWMIRNRNSLVEKELERIAPSLVLFDNEQKCWEHVLQYENQITIFLLVDAGYDSSMVGLLEELAQVKHLYRAEEFADIKKLRFRITHDLITHYGQLGDQLKVENRNQEACQMFLRAQQLCKILFY